MPTYLKALLESSNDRWGEVDVLLSAAEKESKSSSRDLHDALCRASIVLIAAHLEGIIRECAKAILQDINTYSTFKNAPSTVKRTFCSTFISEEGKEANARILKLIAVFDSLDTKLSHEPFLFDGKYDDQKNASPTAIEKITNNFGIRNIFMLIENSKLDLVFSSSLNDVLALKQDLFGHLSANTDIFPYTVDNSLFDLDALGPDLPKGKRTIWQEFLDELMKQRHMIAHGSQQINGRSVGEIRLDKEKVLVLILGVMLCLCKTIQ